MKIPKRVMRMFGQERGERPEPNRIFAITWSIFVLLFWVCVLTDEDGYFGLLDNFNLVIHEGGHFLLMPFGQTMHFLGGTLLQCLLPAICAAYFWGTRQPAGVAFSGLWLGENFLNVARCISDARDMALPRARCSGGSDRLGHHDPFFRLVYLGKPVCRK